MSASYYVRMQACLVAALSGLILLVRLWPAPAAEPPPDVVYSSSDEAVIQFEEIAQTAQPASAPPPPLPPVPIETEPEWELEEPDANLDFSLDLGDITSTLPRSEGAALASAASVEEAARPVRFVEPEYTSDARKRNLKAEIVVRLRIGIDGTVSQPAVTERYLLDSRSGQRQAVAEVGFGLEESALSAARRWVFRPARRDGSAVESYFHVTFSFGV